MIAVGEAMRYIRDGMADVMIAGGAEAPLSPLTFGAFDFIRTMSRWTGDPPFACRPFDRERDGFVMGEGAAALVIEEYEHALRRGAPIYAEVLGYALNNEACHMTTPLPSGEVRHRLHARRSRRRAPAPPQIDYINAHASGTQLNDANEALCLRPSSQNASRPSAGQRRSPRIRSAPPAPSRPRSARSHCTSFLPPTLHFQTPDPLATSTSCPTSAAPPRCVTR